MNILLPSAYLAPIQYYSRLFQCGADTAYIEAHDNYAKQTYRNRCIIADANGPLALTIPTEKTAEGKCLMRDIRISDHGNWRHQHWNAMVSAYRKSPFFDYYADDFAHFYEEHDGFLMDFNLRLHIVISELIGLEKGVKIIDNTCNASDFNDLRFIAEPKALTDIANYTAQPYYQVFAGRNGFIPNLSIVDLLFNMGPEGLIILRG